MSAWKKQKKTRQITVCKSNIKERKINENNIDQLVFVEFVKLSRCKHHAQIKVLWIAAERKFNASLKHKVSANTWKQSLKPLMRIRSAIMWNKKACRVLNTLFCAICQWKKHSSILFPLHQKQSCLNLAESVKAPVSNRVLLKHCWKMHFIHTVELCAVRLVTNSNK